MADLLEQDFSSPDGGRHGLAHLTRGFLLNRLSHNLERSESTVNSFCHFRTEKRWLVRINGRGAVETDGWGALLDARRYSS